MKKFLKSLLIKSKLYAPIIVAITFSIIIITIQAIYNLKRSIYSSIERDLVSEIGTVNEIFNHERTSKFKNIETFLDITSDQLNRENITTLNDSSLIKIGSTKNIWVRNLNSKSNSIYLTNNLLTILQKQTSCLINIYQKTSEGYVILNSSNENNHERSKLLPQKSVNTDSINKYGHYFGKTIVNDSLYITGFKTFTIDKEPNGLICIACKEYDLPELKKIINRINIGKSGMLYVFDNKGKLIINKNGKGENWENPGLTNYVLQKKKGITRIKDKISGRVQIVAFDYSKDNDFYIAATVFEDEETKELISNIVSQSFIYGSIIFILLSLFIYFITTENLHTYLKQLEISNEKLSSARVALEQSEKKFRTLFNNSSDEVFVADFQGKFVELNEVACNTLEYTREELLKMRFFDIKTKKYKPYVSENIKKIIEKGFYTFETEHVTKSGKVLPFEVKSRVIDYEGRPLILSITRNILDRKAIEKQIVQTIIETELNERKRFSADLHDGLGPVLSAIRLYSDLIKRGNFKNMSLEEAVANIDELVDMAIANTKEISNNITPNVLEDFGLSVAIQEFCSFISRTKSIEIDLDINNFTITKSGLETTILYQTVKELINNTLKHANAKNIRIELKNQHNQVILYYRDDGIGFNFEEKLNAKSGLGLRNIINKIKTLKGNCDFNSNEGKGMFVVVTLNIES